MGKRHSDQIRHYKYTDDFGCKYSGGFSNQKRHGKGKLECPDDIVYEGNFGYGQFSGHGKISQRDYFFEGDFVKGIPQGKGKCLCLKGPFICYTEGEYKRGEIDGDGEETCVKVDDFKTPKALIKQHQTGTGDGFKYYKGSFKVSEYFGYGQLTFSNQDTYEGFFRDGIRHGNGIMSKPDGAKFYGTFKYDKREGLGIIYEANGTKSEVSFKNDERQGPGLISYQDGTKLITEFVDDKMNGKYIFYADDGKKIVGLMKNNDIVDMSFKPGDFTAKNEGEEGFQENQAEDGDEAEFIDEEAAKTAVLDYSELEKFEKESEKIRKELEAKQEQLKRDVYEAVQPKEVWPQPTLDKEAEEKLFKEIEHDILHGESQNPKDSSISSDTEHSNSNTECSGSDVEHSNSDGDAPNSEKKDSGENEENTAEQTEKEKHWGVPAGTKMGP